MDLRKLYDRFAAAFITLGGAAIIVSIMAVFVFILLEVIPLFSTPSSGAAVRTVASPLAAGAVGAVVDEHRQTASVVFKSGEIKVFSSQTGQGRVVSEGAPVTAFSLHTSGRMFAAGSADGVASIYGISYEETYPDGKRKVVATVRRLLEIPVASSAITYISLAAASGSCSVAAGSADGRLFLASASVPEEDDDPFAEDAPDNDGAEAGISVTELTGDLGAETVTAVAAAEAGAFVYAGTASGRILKWKRLPDSSGAVFLGSQKAVKDRSRITMMGVLLGGQSIAVGDSSGGLSVWLRPAGREVLRRAHRFESFKGAVSLFANSLRTRGFLVADSLGNIGVFHSTTARRRLLIENREPVSALVFAPKGNAVAAATADGSFKVWEIKNDYAEISLKNLFTGVWYEGYDSPIHMWQSTGGTDEFEPKLGLAPIIFGTFKGAIYSLFFAVPVALLAALCVSQFLHPSFGKFIKPVIEIMAGLPSVVVGFFAGLWLSPVLEKVFPALVIMPFVTAVFAFAGLYARKIFVSSMRGRFRPGAEYALLVPFLIGAVAVSLWLNAPAEQLLFHGDYKQWLAAVGLDFDQRNALVVGFAMGFAVIPIVFTIAEDSMSGVPAERVAASLALGANRWQTAVRVVVPSASAGILAAVVIGFGRAVGETMIVLMATGNTPLLDWNVFNGFRTMSANIAVELPEAPQGGGLYRLIFFTSLLLFLFTFCLNTAAEFIRERLGRKYGSS